MSCVITKEIKGRQYLYESVSYRDDNGQPRTRRKFIGKIEPGTGVRIYSKEYIERMTTEGRLTEINTDIKRYSDNDIKRSKMLEYGASYLYKRIAEEIGLYRVLQEAIPDAWKEVFTVACYLVSNDEPVMYCNDWVEKTDGLPVRALSASGISRLFKDGIGIHQRNEFYRRWAAYRQEREYLAIDISSASSYSKFISEVEWGHNRDKEKLPQVNLCLIMGEESKNPVYQIPYSGSITDVTTLRTTLKLASHLSLGELKLVMDKGFYKKRNIDILLADGTTKFITAASFNADYVCKLVESSKHSIDRADNAILLGEDTILGMTREVKWDSEHSLYAHVYHNAIGAAVAKTELYGFAASLAEIARADPHSEKHAKKFDKYLAINKTPDAQLTVNIRQDVLEGQLATSGWLVLLSNHISDASKAIHIYRAKDAVEKGFDRFKNSLDMKRLRVHSSEGMENKAFVAFIGLILISRIHKVMSEKNLYLHMTMKRLVHTLEKLRVQFIDENRVLFPLTKQQSDIYDAFGFDAPV